MADQIALLAGGTVIAADAPRRLYHDPPDLDAAASIGEFNLLAAQASGATARTVLGEIPIVGPGPGPEPLRGRCQVMLRPEQLQIKLAAGDADTAARVLEVQYLGPRRARPPARGRGVRAGAAGADPGRAPPRARSGGVDRGDQRGPGLAGDDPASPGPRAAARLTGAMPPAAARLAGLGTTIFTEMTALAVRTGAINLGQGFPDTDGPAAVIEAAVAALRGGENQYAPLPGVPALREAIFAHQRQLVRAGARGRARHLRGHRGDRLRGDGPVRSGRRGGRVRALL